MVYLMRSNTHFTVLIVIRPEADVDVFGESQDPQDATDLFDDDEAEEQTFGVENEEGTRSRGQ